MECDTESHVRTVHDISKNSNASPSVRHSPKDEGITVLQNLGTTYPLRLCYIIIIIIYLTSNGLSPSGSGKSNLMYYNRKYINKVIRSMNPL